MRPGIFESTESAFIAQFRWLPPTEMTTYMAIRSFTGGGFLDGSVFPEVAKEIKLFKAIDMDLTRTHG